MCHRSEAADETIEDLTQVYDEGDLVKAVVLKVKVGAESETMPSSVALLLSLRLNPACLVSWCTSGSVCCSFL